MTIAQQHYLLSPGDHFFVPQGTLYSMVNHSGTVEAEVAFTVIKPPRAPGGDDEAGGEGGEGVGDEAGDGAAAAAAAGAGASPMPAQPRFEEAAAGSAGRGGRA